MPNIFDQVESNIKGCSILCLAAAGAEVTVIDLSEKMLEKDRLMAEKYGLTLYLEHGNMIDLSVFQEESFDYIVNPVSLCYVPDVRRVFRECHRILKSGGGLIECGFVIDGYTEDQGEDITELFFMTRARKR